MKKTLAIVFAIAIATINRRREAMNMARATMTVMLAAFVAIGTVPAHVWAQDTTSSEDENSTSCFWGEDAHILAFNIWGLVGTNWAQSEDQAKKAARTYFEKVVVGKKKAKMVKGLEKEFEKFWATIVRILKAQAPSEFKIKKKAFEEHAAKFGCTPGEPASDGCKDFHKNSAALTDRILLMVPDTEERKFLSEMLRTLISDDYRDFGEGYEDDYFHLALMEQAALSVLPGKYWDVFTDKYDGMPGTLMTPDQLATKAGDQITIICPGKEMFSGILDGITTNTSLVVKTGTGRGGGEFENLELCKIWLSESGGPSRCAIARKAFDDGLADFEGAPFIRTCPKDELLKDKDVLVCAEGESNPKTAKITKAVPEFGISFGFEVPVMDALGQPLMDADNKPQTMMQNTQMTCANLAEGKPLVMLKPKDGGGGSDGETVYLHQNMFRLRLGGHHGFGLAGNSDDVQWFDGHIGFDIAPLVTKNFLLYLRLGIGAAGVFSYHEGSSEDSDNRADVLAMFGLGATIRFNNVLGMSINADALVTTAKFGGVMASLLLDISFNPEGTVGMSFGPFVAWNRFGVPPGIQPGYEDCIGGNPVCDEAPPSHTEAFSIGYMLQLFFNFGPSSVDLSAGDSASSDPAPTP